MPGDPLSLIAAKGVSDLIVKLVGSYAARTLEAAPEKVREISSNIGPHITDTFNRCIKVKTLLNPLSPAEFLSVYATQRFYVERRELDHYEMVERIKRETRHLIITGTGGSGKSMFTRYLWLSLFLDGDGRIPLFIELRNLNSVQGADLLSYIYHSITSGRAKLTEREFRKRISRGDFIIILDGFDEVSENKKESVQRDIMSLAEEFPGTKLIMTSRPTDAFSSWTSFEVASVAAMHEKDLIELVERAEFDGTVKGQFKKRLKRDKLFDKHRSFLTNPLLASMMLLTFSHSYDIPDRMYTFYQQAFDALYQRHDSHKPGGYKREFKTVLNEGAFKRLFSYFCLGSYLDRKFDFDREQALFYIERAAKVTGDKIDPAAFLDDLCMCVCMLVPEGMSLVFAHRSFQEYFCAYCLAYVTQNRFCDIVENISTRRNDQVISLLADMNPETLRKLYVLPLAEEYSEFLQLGARRPSLAKYLEGLGQSFDLTQEVDNGPKRFEVYLDETTPFSNFSDTIYRLGKGNTPWAQFDRETLQSAAHEAMFRVLDIGPERRIRVRGDGAAFRFSLTDGDNPKGEEAPISAEMEAELQKFFESSLIYEYIEDRFSVVRSYLSAERKVDKTQFDALGELLRP